MKKSEFRALIREEIKKVLKESSVDTFRKQYMQSTAGIEADLKRYFDSTVGGVTTVDASMMKGSPFSGASIEITFNKDVRQSFNNDTVEEFSDNMQAMMGLKPISNFEMISPMKVRLYL